MDSKTTELLPGTLDLLILKAVSLKRLHGYGVLLRIRQISQEMLEVPQGSLYPALYRLEHQGLITSVWGESENKRRAKYYTLTRAGRKRLKDETAVDCQLQSAIENRLDVELMLGYLNDTQREVLYLHHVESLSAAEIASITERPRATVLSQLSRARRKLQMLFAQGNSEEDTQRENRVV